MQKIGLFILGLFTIFFSGNLTQANSEYEYTNLDITANILIDGTIDVREDFTANFFVQKHGIIRDIPLNYAIEGNDFHIEVSNINVKGKKFTINQNGGNIEIKIGDAYKTLIGEQNYPISYSTYGLIKNFSGMGYAELYRNLVGYDFDTNINKVKAEFYLPKIYTGFKPDDFLITTDGESKTTDGFDGTVDWSQGDKIIITYDKKLPKHQGITLAIKFPNNYFEFDDERQNGLGGNIEYNRDYGNYGNNESLLDLFTTIPVLINIILSGNGDSGTLTFLLIISTFTLIIFIPIITIIIIFLKFLFKLYNNNKPGIKKEFKDKYPVIIQYNPPKGLNSAEVGILLHRYINPKDTFSLIYKRAYEGLIEIQSGMKSSNFSLIKKKDIPLNCPEFEKKLFKNLFTKNELKIDKKTHLYSKLTNCGLKKYCIDKGRLIKNETTGCNNVQWLYVILLFIGTPILCIIFPQIGIGFFLTMWCIGFISGKTGLLQWKDLEGTEEGAKLISHILGYKQFLKTCDENKLRLFLQQDPLYFDKILPYAVVFGLNTKLIKKMIPIMKEMNISPTRYNGDISSFSKVTNKINNMAYSGSSHNSNSGGNSGSSFSGGGSSFSSGGGGGGGGGRSW